MCFDESCILIWNHENISYMLKSADLQHCVHTSYEAALQNILTMKQLELKGTGRLKISFESRLKSLDTSTGGKMIGSFEMPVVITQFCQNLSKTRIYQQISDFFRFWDPQVMLDSWIIVNHSWHERNSLLKFWGVVSHLEFMANGMYDIVWLWQGAVNL